MSTADIKGAEAAKAEALDYVARVTGRRNDLTRNIETAMVVAQDNGASLRQIAAVSGMTAQGVANLTRRVRQEQERQESIARHPSNG